ncbi:ribonuclease P protein subunit p40-like isoform X1 [Ostrinia furnacalis]|uniref:ribonuclease P protein subunit p40-like isoform X1 n=1 Tax=Ostrinia furnacalis TaxID=93504 RepID=UPI00103FDB52|nr:ribonuclease P protein subunit p40-like isoform X1 [Ostrinia furnacalis]
MLCPEVYNFPSPKVYTSSLESQNLDLVTKTLKMNSFYESVVITCPDEVNTPSLIQETLLEDSDYYKISGISLTEFLDQTFIENFVKKGHCYCLSSERNCLTQNCAAITPDGMLTLHILEFVFQTLGLEGTKRPHNYYEVKIDLKSVRHVEKLRNGLSKLELFDFIVTWEPDSEEICPSSIAKFFHDRGMRVSQCPLKVTKVNPTIKEIPSLKDVEVDEMVEWVGMLAHNADMDQEETYISTYGPPESEYAIKSTRISVLIVKGLLTPTVLLNLCKNLSEYTNSRELDDYWTSVSIQSFQESLWQWNPSSPRMFQSHDSSCNIFFTKSGHKIYSVGQLNYS